MTAHCDSNGRENGTAPGEQQLGEFQEVRQPRARQRLRARNAAPNRIRRSASHGAGREPAGGGAALRGGDAAAKAGAQLRLPGARAAEQRDGEAGERREARRVGAGRGGGGGDGGEQARRVRRRRGEEPLLLSLIHI